MSIYNYVSLELVRWCSFFGIIIIVCPMEFTALPNNFGPIIFIPF